MGHWAIIVQIRNGQLKWKEQAGGEAQNEINKVLRTTTIKCVCVREQ